MAININDPQADALTRTFARMAGLSIREAIVTAMKEAIDRRRNREKHWRRQDGFERSTGSSLVGRQVSHFSAKLTTRCGMTWSNGERSVLRRGIALNRFGIMC